MGITQESYRERKRKNSHDWRARNPEKVREHNAKRKDQNHGNRPKYREYAWRKRGIEISFETFEAILQKQGGRCGICRKPLLAHDTDAHLDHCHQTRSIRGVLCAHCNHAIGLLGNSPEVAIAAAHYLANNDVYKFLPSHGTGMNRQAVDSKQDRDQPLKELQ